MTRFLQNKFSLLDIQYWSPLETSILQVAAAASFVVTFCRIYVVCTACCAAVWFPWNQFDRICNRTHRVVTYTSNNTKPKNNDIIKWKQLISFVSCNGQYIQSANFARFASWQNLSVIFFELVEWKKTLFTFQCETKKWSKWIINFRWSDASVWISW